MKHSIERRYFWMSWINIYCRMKWQEQWLILFNDLASSVPWLLFKKCITTVGEPCESKVKGRILNWEPFFYPDDNLMQGKTVPCPLFLPVSPPSSFLSLSAPPLPSSLPAFLSVCLPMHLPWKLGNLQEVRWTAAPQGTEPALLPSARSFLHYLQEEGRVSRLFPADQRCIFELGKDVGGKQRHSVFP